MQLTDVIAVTAASVQDLLRSVEGHSQVTGVSQVLRVPDVRATGEMRRQVPADHAFENAPVMDHSFTAEASQDFTIHLEPRV